MKIRVARVDSPPRMKRGVRDSGDPVDAKFPSDLTTGRLVTQYLSSTYTRRIARLIDQNPDPKIEIHPHLRSIMESRRGIG